MAVTALEGMLLDGEALGNREREGIPSVEASGGFKVQYAFQPTTKKTKQLNPGSLGFQKTRGHNGLKGREWRFP